MNKQNSINPIMIKKNRWIKTQTKRQEKKVFSRMLTDDYKVMEWKIAIFSHHNKEQFKQEPSRDAKGRKEV